MKFLVCLLMISLALVSTCLASTGVSVQVERGYPVPRPAPYPIPTPAPTPIPVPAVCTPAVAVCPDCGATAIVVDAAVGRSHPVLKAIGKAVAAPVKVLVRNRQRK